MDDINKSLQKVTFEDSPVSDTVSEELDVEFHEPYGVDTASVQRIPQQGKHALTPESKLSAESKPKRFAKHSAYNRSSRQCQDRRSILCEEIKNFVVGQNDSSSFVKQSVLLDLLELTVADKSLLTRCITACYPESRRNKNSENEVVYSHISLQSSLPSSGVAKELFAENSNQIFQMQNQISEVEQWLTHEWEMVVGSLHKNDVQQANVAALKYQSKLGHYFNLNSALVKLYENDIEKLKRMHSEDPISSSQKQQMLNEIKELEGLCSLGLKGDGDIDGVIHEKVFSKLLDNVEEKCPLIYSILQTLLVSDSRRRVNKTPEYKLKCGINALALLLSVRNQKFTNDVRLVFGLLCITYGAGKQFVNMLHAIGLTPHWDTLNNFLDQRLEQLQTAVSDKCSDLTPVILLMDNINIYRGKKRHDRLFKEVGPKMWNFTGRAAIIPDLTDIKDLISCRETTTQPQTDVTSLKPEDIFLESMPEHKMLWENWCDRYYLELLDKSLNCVPTPPKPFTEMSETEVHSWLQTTNFEALENQGKFKIKKTPDQEFCKNMQSTEKTNVINLSLSLEDNSTLTGTAAIFEEFAEEFGISSDIPNGYILFDSTKKEFDLQSARQRYSFTKSVQLHHVKMAEIEKQMLLHEKDIDQTEVQVPSQDMDSESDDSEVDNYNDQATEEHVLNQKENAEKFNTFFKKLVDQAQATVHSCDDSSLDKMVHELTKNNKKLNDMRDHYGRAILHAAVEEKQYTLTNVLLASGINPNAQEGCGATPMSIAVINSDVNFCKLLMDNFAEYQGEMFGSFPSPLDMAIAMETTEIINLFNTFSQNMESPIVNLIQSDTALPTPESHELDDDEMCDISSTSAEFTYKRSECKEFPTAVVGDVGTCKNNRSVKNKDNTAYGWCAEIPGDMHAKGYLCEAAFKAHGNGGFHKVVNAVMKRPKLTVEAFKKRKFQDQNLNRIKEGVRDGSQSYGMAAVQEFQVSTEFPSDDDLKKILQKFGNHNHILLERFKKWMKESAEKDESNEYHQQLFSLFGPLLELFITAGKQGDGQLREIVWVILLPIFAQLEFRNYWTEAFVHIVNFTALWPLGFRNMIKHNSTVNLSGKSGHNVDLDEYVETYIVKPLKTYTTGQTSVQMCQRLMGNLNLFGSTRSAYSSPQAFDVHPTTKHKEQSPFPDQIKGMWFCLKNGFFKVSSGKIPFQYPLKGDSGVQKPVSKMFMHVKEKGEKKVKEKFESKLHDSFPSFRKFSFERVLIAADNDHN